MIGHAMTAMKHWLLGKRSLKNQTKGDSPENSMASRGKMARFKGQSSWRRRLPHIVALCLLSIAICAGLDSSQMAGRSEVNALSYFEQYAYIVRMIIHGEQRSDLVEKARQKIVLVTITDDTFRQFSGPPMPRENHARVVRELTKAGAKVIGLDLIFDAYRADNPQGDKALSAAARGSKNVLWAAMTNHVNGEVTLSQATPAFRDASPHQGHINAGDVYLKQLEQPVVDRLKIAVSYQGQSIPAFSLAAARMAANITDKPLDRVPFLGSKANAKIPLDANGQFRITFLGGGQPVFPEIPYEAIYRGEAQNEFYRTHAYFRDKIVLIGDNTTFGKDFPHTPIGGMAGVEIQAHAIATLLLGCFIREAPPWVNLALIVFMGAIVCPLAAARKLQWVVLGVLFTLLSFFVINVWLFVFYGWWLHLIGPSAALILATAFMIIERGLFEEREKEHMFDALVSAAGSAIERRDPSTSGHSQRVTALTIALAEAVSQQRTGPFKAVRFSSSQLKELRYAGLLHDFGKIGVRENVLTKSHKLEPRHFEAVVSRLLLARQALCLDFAQRHIKLLESDENPITQIQNLERDQERKLAQIDADIELLAHSNDPLVTYLADAQYEKLHQLLDRLEPMSYRGVAGEQIPVLSGEERNALSIRKGSLTPEEYREVQKHAALSFDFLEQIPWTDSLSNIPEIARAHHEKLNGSGYPQGIGGDQIPLQARIMTIADIYDALTAADRPYKKAMPVGKALHLLRDEANQGALDLDLLEIFIEQQIYAVTEDWSYAPPPKAEAAPGTPLYAA